MKGKFTISDVSEKIDLDDLKPYLDIPHNITILIGKTTMKIGELLQLERGDIVELTKSAGESLDVMANDKLIAQGDVIVIDDRFAVRITELFDYEEDDA